MEAYITDQNFDMICLSEIFLNSSIQNDDHKLRNDDYNLIRFDHPSGSRKVRICIYYKRHCPLIRYDDLYTLDNCLATEIRSQSKNSFLTCAYRSPS